MADAHPSPTGGTGTSFVFASGTATMAFAKSATLGCGGAIYHAAFTPATMGDAITPKECVLETLVGSTLPSFAMAGTIPLAKLEGLFASLVTTLMRRLRGRFLRLRGKLLNMRQTLAMDFGESGTGGDRAALQCVIKLGDGSPDARQGLVCVPHCKC